VRRASTQDLKVLTEALTNNKMPFAFSSIWFQPTDVTAADADLTEQKRLEVEQAAQRAQKNADDAKLAAERAKDLGATLSAKQTALQSQYGNSAATAAARITAEVIRLHQRSERAC
jgi:poly-D-alanine transfer protein DltD